MAYALANESNEDRFYTQVDAGDVRLFTLDQLDAAFQAGLIHENTYVCREGETAWQTLFEIASLGDEPTPLEATPAPVAPVAAPAPQQSAPKVWSMPPAESSPASIAPLARDLALDSDPDLLALKPRRRGAKVVLALASLGIAAAAFAAAGGGALQRALGSAGDASLAAAAPASLSLAAINRAPELSEAPRSGLANQPAAEPQRTPTADESGADSKSSGNADDERFSAEVRDALLKQDQKVAAKQRTPSQTRTPVRRKNKGGKNEFRSGGSAYDPLNAKL
jgi:hypothetical protein